jgi:hypothetical protein
MILPPIAGAGPVQLEEVCIRQPCRCRPLFQEGGVYCHDRLSEASLPRRHTFELLKNAAPLRGIEALIEMPVVRHIMMVHEIVVSTLHA